MSEFSPSEKVVFIAPGQGSQRPNLIELAERIPDVMETYEQADCIAIELFGKNKKIEGKSLTEWASVGTDEELQTRTTITQPLVTATTVGLIKYLKRTEKGTTAYGHSLGELAALFAAGSLTEDNTLGLSMLRGVYSHEATKDQSGMMAALLNIPHEFLEDIKFGEKEGVVISTTNSPDQLTISGRPDKVKAIVNKVTRQFQRARGLSKDERRQLPHAVMMKIGSGFHSFMMKPAQKAFRESLDATAFSVPSEMNFFSNHSHDYEGSPDKIRQHLVEQLVHPLNFWYDIGRLVLDGHTRIIEVGPGKVLSKELGNQKAKGNLPAELEIVAVETELRKSVA